MISEVPGGVISARWRQADYWFGCRLTGGKRAAMIFSISAIISTIYRFYARRCTAALTFIYYLIYFASWCLGRADDFTGREIIYFLARFARLDRLALSLAYAIYIFCHRCSMMITNNAFISQRWAVSLIRWYSSAISCSISLCADFCDIPGFSRMAWCLDASHASRQDAFASVATRGGELIILLP